MRALVPGYDTLALIGIFKRQRKKRKSRSVLFVTGSTTFEIFISPAGSSACMWNLLGRRTVQAWHRI